MKFRTFQVDATSGPNVKPGNLVQPGRDLGRDSDGNPVLSDVRGTVSGIEFNGAEHVFLIRIALEKDIFFPIDKGNQFSIEK